MEKDYSSTQTLLLFQESGIDYALNTNKIHEVINRPSMILPSPLPNCIGSIYFDNILVPIYPHPIQSQTKTPNDTVRSIIIFWAFADYRKYWLGFKADEIRGVVQIDSEKVFHRHEWPMLVIPDFAAGLFFHKNKPVFILDPISLMIAQPNQQPHMAFEPANQAINF